MIDQRILKQISVVETFIMEEGQTTGSVSGQMALQALAIIRELLGDQVEIVSEHSGLAQHEEEIMRHLILAWTKFLGLAPGSDDCTEFRMAINRCQALIGSRVLRRRFPSYWL